MRKLHVLAAAAAMTASSLFADVQIGKGLSVGGYLDLVYFNNSTDTGGADVDASGFDAVTAEIDFMMDFGGGLTAQVDLEGAPGTDGDDSAIDVEQARIDYAIGQGTLTLGKFDTFIGLEALEGPDLYQISTSLTTALMPTQHEGIAYAYDNGQWNFKAAIVNSYGSDDMNADNGVDSEELSYALHVGFTPSEALSFNLNYAMEGQDGAAAGDIDGVTVFTLDASYSNHGWTIGAEYASVDSDFVDSDSSEVTAWMFMVNYMFTEQFGLTGRYSTAETDDADDTATEFVLCASYAVTPNWALLLEYRAEDTEGYTAGLNGSYGAFGAGATAEQDASLITLETILTF